MAFVATPPGARPDASTRERPPAWASPAGLALVGCLLAAGFAVLTSAVVLIFGSTDQTDWSLFGLTLMVLVPLAVAGGGRIARGVEAAGGPPAVDALATLVATGLLAVFLVARLTYTLGGSSSVVLLALVPGLVAALGAVFTRAPRLPGGWAPAGALAIGCVIAVLPATLAAPGVLAISVALAGALWALHLRLAGVAAPRWVLRGLDVVVAAVVIGLVVDVGGYVEYLRPDARGLELDGVDIAPRALAYVSRIHEGFYLGPLNDVLHGHAMLVETSSQYGVAVFYFLGAIFAFAPLGYGSLGFVAGALTALQYGLIYGLMRLAGVARTLAIPAIGAAVIGLMFGFIGSFNDFPATGALRVGIPWLVVGLGVASARCGRRRGACLGGAAALVGVAAIWSLETFVYTAATFAAVAAVEAGSHDPGQRVRVFVRLAGQAAVACVLAHVVLAVGTRVVAGAWPDWSTYVAFLQVYSTQGDLYVLVVAAWSPGLLLIGVHLGSAIGVAGMLARRHPLAVKRRAALMMIAAASGLGLTSVTYFIGNSHPSSLFFTGFPALVEVVAWMSLAGDRVAGISRRLRVYALAAGFWLAALLAVSGWTETTDEFRRSALAHALPGGQTLRGDLSFLWHSPPSDPRVLETEELVRRHWAPGERALVLLEPELTIETLVRTDRANLLPIGHPEQDNLVPDETEPKVLRAVDRLPPGTLMLVAPASFGRPAKRIAENVPAGLVALQKVALDRIRARFGLQLVDSTPGGFAVMRLVARPR